MSVVKELSDREEGLFFPKNHQDRTSRGDSWGIKTKIQSRKALLEERDAEAQREIRVIRKGQSKAAAGRNLGRAPCPMEEGEAFTHYTLYYSETKAGTGPCGGLRAVGG